MQCPAPPSSRSLRDDCLTLHHRLGALRPLGPVLFWIDPLECLVLLTRETKIERDEGNSSVRVKFPALRLPPAFLLTWRCQRIERLIRDEIWPVASRCLPKFDTLQNSEQPGLTVLSGEVRVHRIPTLKGGSDPLSLISLFSDHSRDLGAMVVSDWDRLLPNVTPSSKMVLR